ncbi:MAG: hypothetical protein FJZ01_11160 [Candidatus Sericytochromatia bacterium]|nr:hypothetical protein [Candidatus Tanganyikabacteria bacterium]
MASRRFAVPALPGPHVPRPQLCSRLAAGRAPGKVLTLVQGGAGSGKTTLLAEYARGADLPATWLGISDAEQDPVVFFEQLAAALAHACPGLSDQAASLVRTNPRESLALAMGLLCDDLAAALSGPLLLVLDGAEHLPSDEAALRALEVLVASLPAEAQLVIAGRALPALKLAQLRLRDQVVEVGEPDLRLGDAELERFLAAFDGDPDQAAALAGRTHGWVAGVVYALGTHPADPMRPLERPELLYGYLGEEVYAQVPEMLRRHLLAIAHLDGVDLAACRALFGAEADAVLAAVAGLPFVQRADDLPALHPLYQEFLRHTARTSLDVGDRQALYRRLADQVARTPEQAVRWLLQAALWPEAEERLLAALPVLLRDGRLATVRALTAEFPVGIVRASARLMYIQAETARRAGNLALALEQFGEAERLARERHDEPALGLVWAGLAAAHADRGETESQREYAQRALLVLPEAAREAFAASLNILGTYHLFRRELDKAETELRRAQARFAEAGDAAGEGRVLHNLGLGAALAGEFERAIGLYQESIRRLEEAGRFPLPLTYANMAFCLLYLGRLAEARAAVETGMAVAERTGARRARVFLLQALGRLQLAGPDVARARETFDLALVEATQTGNRISEINAHVALAECHLRAGDVPAADRAVERAQAVAGRDLSDPALLDAVLVRAEADLAAGRTEEAEAHLRIASASLAEAPHPLSALHLERLRSDWHWRRGDEAAASRHRAAARALCARHGLPEPGGGGAEAPAEDTAIPVLAVRVLGTFDVAVDGKEIAPRSWRSAGSKLVLAYLLHHPGGATKEALIELLYPDADPAKSALHVTINRLRQALEPDAPKGAPSRFVLFHDGRYLLNPGLHARFDAGEFRSAIREARRAEAAPAARAALLDEALALYRGPFLEEFPDVEWCRLERENLRRLALEGYEARFALAAAADAWTDLEALADGLLALEPGEDVAYRAKLAALAMQERTADALRMGQLAGEAVERAGGSLAPETRDLIAALEASQVTVRTVRDALPPGW